MATVILFLILSVPGQKGPVPYQKDMPSVEECVLEAANLLQQAQTQIKHPSAIQVGCIYVPPVSEEH